MSRFNESALPEAAREKLLGLETAKIEAEDAARSAASRINGLGRSADPRLVERLQRSQAKNQQRHEELHLLVSRIRQYLNALPPNAVLEPAEPVKATPRQGQFAQAIARLRDEITAAQNHLRAVKTAPLPKTALKEKAAQFVHELAAHARPKIGAGSSGLTVTFSPPNADTIAHHGDVAAFMCWLSPASMIAALERELDLLPEQQQPMPAAEREQRAAELAEQLLELERCEVALITAAHEQEGLEILHRQDCDPRAVLGVSIAVKQRALAAA